jgi:hypothetical protein
MCWILIYSIFKAACVLNGSQHSGTASAMYNSDYMVLCCITLLDSLVSVPCGQKRVGLLIKYDIIIEISKEQVCAFCWFRVVNLVINNARDEQ